MALRLDSANTYPMGHFDMLDSELSSIKGGEVGALKSVTITADLAAADADDGYSGTSTKKRPVISKTLASGNRPLGLIDGGTANYGTLFGKVIGGTAGKVQTGTDLGPHSGFASGKVGFCVAKGTYKVTLDALNSDFLPSDANLDAGDPLYATTAGLLTQTVGSSFEASLSIARFLEFTTDGSLVTTPRHLVSAVNSPSGSLPQTLQFTQAVIYWSGVS